MDTTVDETELAEMTKRNNEQIGAGLIGRSIRFNRRQNGSVSREQLQSWWKKLHGTDHCVLP